MVQETKDGRTLNSYQNVPLDSSNDLLTAQNSTRPGTAGWPPALAAPEADSTTTTLRNYLPTATEAPLMPSSEQTGDSRPSEAGKDQRRSAEHPNSQPVSSVARPNENQKEDFGSRYASQALRKPCPRRIDIEHTHTKHNRKKAKRLGPCPATCPPQQPACPPPPHIIRRRTGRRSCKVCCLREFGIALRGAQYGPNFQ